MEEIAEKSRRDLTLLLQDVSDGDPSAAAKLLPLVYDELRALAANHMRRTPAGQTLQPTALTHEAYMRLLGGHEPGWENRGHFFFAAARAMHDILIENARRKLRKKRGGGWRRMDMDQLVVAIDAPADELIALSEALEDLESHDPRSHKIVMLRFFAGLTLPDVAKALGISLATAKRDWTFARVQLHDRLTKLTAGNTTKETNG